MSKTSIEHSVSKWDNYITLLTHMAQGTHQRGGHKDCKSKTLEGVLTLGFCCCDKNHNQNQLMEE